MKIKQILLAATATALLSTSAFASSQADYDSAVAAATAELKAANKAGNEWRDSGKLLKKAAAAAKKGDLAKATKLAKAAQFQGKIAQQQAAEQAQAGNPAYLYD